MASFLVFYAAYVSAVLVPVVGQPGFISIDCGLDPSNPGYVDSYAEVMYVPDGPYVDSGENHKIAVERVSRSPSECHLTVRSFPTGGRNCYMLPTRAGGKYLVTMEFMYGDYDGKNSSLIRFDLYIGVNYWSTIQYGDGQCELWCTMDAIFVAWANWTPVCLVDTGWGTPFVSLLQLRPLGDATYPPVTASQSLALYTRRDMGGTSFVRYPRDPYDRYWWTFTDPSLTTLSTTLDIRPDAGSEGPLTVLRTAVEPAGNGTTFTITWQDGTHRGQLVFLHFADFQDGQLRQFDVYINGERLRPGSQPYSPSYLAASCVYNAAPYKDPVGMYNITLVAVAASALPPMLNALEIYRVITHDNPMTLPQDFDAIMAIKVEYGIKKNWMGDPCYPTKYSWDGLKCSNTRDNATRITSLDLSNSNLHGVISNNFTLLTALEYLDLSHNNFIGQIPGSLASLPSLQVINLSCNQLSGPIPDSYKKFTGSLNSRYGFEGGACDRKISTSHNKKTVQIISIVLPVTVLAVVVALFLKRRRQKNSKNLVHDNIAVPVNRVQNIDNRQFTYEELEMFTNKFAQTIGQGGFGNVYYGRLEDGTEVAIKLRFELSSHGLDAFLAEVRSLTKVHHRNLVSLVGYCWDMDHLALVYEYMLHGNLCDHLRGKGRVAGLLNWGTRVRLLIDAAQGLDYVHNGCILPIIHRDVKSSNILLGQNLQAKIADFGLSKIYLNDNQTHISTTVAGSAGYIDPEYYHTGRLTERSDVYSFGVVLLEVATGEPPVVPGHGHIVQRVKQKLADGSIVAIADARLGGSYDASSMWKVVDAAMLCTANASARRPTMAAVVARLKESLALEEAREKVN